MQVKIRICRDTILHAKGEACTNKHTRKDKHALPTCHFAVSLPVTGILLRDKLNSGKFSPLQRKCLSAALATTTWTPGQIQQTRSSGVPWPCVSAQLLPRASPFPATLGGDWAVLGTHHAWRKEICRPGVELERISRGGRVEWVRRG